MNREIKFRAWNGEGMVDLYSTTKLALASGFNIDGLFIPFHKDYILMQFTGLLDKNGKEIYEGDIVIPTKLKDVPNEVKYIQHGFYRVKIHKNTDYVNPLGNCEVEVIGNIYENKELLNQ